MVFGSLQKLGAFHESYLVNTCKPSSSGVHEVDLSDPEAKTLIVDACKQIGIFKIVNHGIPLEFIRNMEHEALKFFSQPQPQKDKAGPPQPCGYGNKRIGPNGDEGRLEYLLLNTNPDPNTLILYQQNPQTFRSAVKKYARAMKNLCCEVLKVMADGLEIEPRNVFSRMIRDDTSDCLLRVNSYPACPELDEVQALKEQNLIGFGEHTDPQIISILRSNNSSGLQICHQDAGTWVSIQPDQTSFFVIVGDLLQVLTNGIFRSVKHRVVADSMVSRLSMIYFGGPPLCEKIAPLPSFVSKEEESLYRKLSWEEYKVAAYKSRLSDNRLSLFQKSAGR